MKSSNPKTARIMDAIEGLTQRADALEQHPMFRAVTHGPGIPVKALGYPEALAHAHAAHQAKQAEIWQEKARKQLPPGTVPIRPNAYREEQQANANDPHFTGDKRARLSHITFADGKQPDRK